MSGTTSNLLCLVWPDNNPNDHIVEVEIDDNRTVAGLRRMIKDDHANAFARRRSLRLRPVEVEFPRSETIPSDDNLQKTLMTIHFDVLHSRLHPPSSQFRDTRAFHD
jgi:Crinkler effector protein N-terminal domain